METNQQIDPTKIAQSTETIFLKSTLPGLMDFIRIPNLSPTDDPKWETNGLLDKAAKFLQSWIVEQSIQGIEIKILKDEKFAPFLFVKVTRTDKTDKSVLFYGHLDKQPHFTGWKEGLSPIDPKIIGDKLYGRGSVDDGYYLGYPHPECLLTIEGCEESGSFHYHEYLDQLKKEIKEPSLLICMDSGAGDYDHLWTTNSLRGGIEADLKVQVVDEGLHSGDASGIVPSSFRILRGLLDMIEDVKTGQVIDDFQVNIPPHRYEELNHIANTLGCFLWQRFKYTDQMQPTTQDAFQAYVNRTWKAQLSVIGADGFPPAAIAGNVLRPYSTIKLSLRTPPTLNCAEKSKTLKQIFEKNPPYQSKVVCDISDYYQGWNAPNLDPKLQDSLNRSSLNFFGNQVMCQGEGGSIPLIVELQEKFPNMQIIVTGILGPEGNAHGLQLGPNEMLFIPACKKLISCLTQVIAEYSLN